MSTDERTIRAYDNAASSYAMHISDPIDAPLHAYYEKPAMHAEYPQLEGLTVLCLGCGTGEDAQWIKDQGAREVTAIDISPGMVEVAERSYPDINFQVMDMSSLEFADNSFDLLCSSLAIHYIDDWNQSLREALRVLRPGGRFVFSCYHPIESALEYFSNEETRGALLGRTISQQTEERTIHGDYLAAENGGIKRAIGTVATEYTVYYYHRTFGKMMESIIGSGFKIAKLVEPLPLTGMQRDNPEHYKQVMSIPKFLIWVLEKDEAK